MRLAANFLPEKISKKFFGDRKKYGLIPDKNDSDWILWEKEYLNFYDTTQKKGLGSFVNDSGNVFAASFINIILKLHFPIVYTDIKQIFYFKKTYVIK